MATPKKTRESWPFSRKFPLWLADRGLTINGFAKAHGLKQRTLHGWVREGVGVPDDGLRTIALATGLPADYWLNDSAPYPPAIDYDDVVAEVVASLRAMRPEQAREVAAMLKSAEETSRVLAARRALRGD